MENDTKEEPVTTVYQAWAAVMADVQGIAKKDRNEQQRYSFRGIDATVNAVGPALREHNVCVVPTAVVASWRDVQTSTGKASRECTMTVTYRVIGPEGDSFEGQSVGESMDFGDKGAPKAMSVAFRQFLLQALCVPTDDPEPDAQTFERTYNGPQPQHPTPQQFIDTNPPAPITDKTRRELFAKFNDAGITDREAQLTGIRKVIGREVESRSDITEQEARKIIHSLPKTKS